MGIQVNVVRRIFQVLSEKMDILDFKCYIGNVLIFPYSFVVRMFNFILLNE